METPFVEQGPLQDRYNVDSNRNGPETGTGLRARCQDSRCGLATRTDARNDAVGGLLQVQPPSHRALMNKVKLGPITFVRLVLVMMNLASNSPSDLVVSRTKQLVGRSRTGEMRLN